MGETWVCSLGWEDSPGEGKGYPLQYSGLENSMDSVVHGVAESQTWLSNYCYSTLGFLVSQLERLLLSIHLTHGPNISGSYANIVQYSMGLYFCYQKYPQLVSFLLWLSVFILSETFSTLPQ